MVKILTAAQIKELDQYTIANEPIASIELMERASRAFVTWFTEHFNALNKVGVVCGTGNNGGDGLAIARLLKDWGYPVRVWIVKGGDFDPQALVPKKIRPKAQDFYIRGEIPKGELGFFFRADGRTDVPFRCKARSCSFVNLAMLQEISRGILIADLIAIVGSLDLNIGEVDR